MAKIKIENENIIVLYSEEVVGAFATNKINYKIDLTNKKRFLLKNDEEKEIDYGLTKKDESLMVDTLKKDVWFKIENCYQVLVSYREKNDEKNIIKHEKIQEKNKTILEFLKNFS